MRARDKLFRREDIGPQNSIGKSDFDRKIIRFVIRSATPIGYAIWWRSESARRALQEILKTLFVHQIFLVILSSNMKLVTLMPIRVPRDQFFILTLSSRTKKFDENENLSQGCKTSLWLSLVPVGMTGPQGCFIKDA